MISLPLEGPSTRVYEKTEMGLWHVCWSAEQFIREPAVHSSTKNILTQPENYQLISYNSITHNHSQFYIKHDTFSFWKLPQKIILGFFPSSWQGHHGTGAMASSSQSVGPYCNVRNEVICLQVVKAAYLDGSLSGCHGLHMLPAEGILHKT